MHIKSEVVHSGFGHEGLLSLFLEYPIKVLESPGGCVFQLQESTYLAVFVQGEVLQTLSYHLRFFFHLFFGIGGWPSRTCGTSWTTRTSWTCCCREPTSTSTRWRILWWIRWLQLRLALKTCLMQGTDQSPLRSYGLETGYNYLSCSDLHTCRNVRRVRFHYWALRGGIAS